MAQQTLLGSQLGSPVALRNTQVLKGRPVPRIPRGKASKIVVAASKDEEVTPELSTALIISLGATLAASPAFAEAIEAPISSSAAAAAAPPVPTDAVDSAVGQIVETVRAAGVAVKNGLGVAAKGAGYVKEAADTAAPYVKKGVDVAIPYVKATADLVQEVAKPAIKAATPVVQAGVGEVESFLTKQGLNARSLVESTKGVTSKAEEAINYASPTVKSTAGTLSATSPTVLAEYALGLLAIYYLGPPVLKGVFGSLRGFAGQISPAAALDAAANDSSAVIVDIRTASDKEYAGIPDLPNSNRLIELEYANISDRRVRGQLRNASAIEKEMTVLQIAALKKVKKGSRILLLDKNGSVSKDVARALTGKGYKRVFVIAGGFNSWTASKLQTRGSSSVSAVEILGPVFGTRSSTGFTGRSDRPATTKVKGSTKTQRYLPSGR